MNKNLRLMIFLLFDLILVYFNVRIKLGWKIEGTFFYFTKNSNLHLFLF